MMQKDSSDAFRRKDIRKAVRSVFQGIILLSLATAILLAVFDWNEYTAVSGNEYKYDNGFVAVAYFGVDRSRKTTLIDDDMLEKHLTALKANGYQTITQNDIKEYYLNGKKLPEKALYLIFEDGRRDSSLFAQPILEKVNYCASMFTYANKFVYKDFKFLQPDDLEDMVENSFWELGSNGYRFEYINVFDRYENFVGKINQDQFIQVSDYMEDDYNHYLMDFIRDKDRISIENRQQMEERLVWDYNMMNKLYSDELGYVPGAYIIMHANGLDNDSNELVRNVNFREAKKIFNLMFTREGESLNKKSGDLFNLTRMQAQPYWQTNHLLMRVKDDTGMDMDFVVGEQDRAKLWSVSRGAAEFEKSRIILTSPPDGEGRIRLDQSGDYSNFELSVNLDGNVIGEQTIYMRTSNDGKNYIALRLRDNILYIERCEMGRIREIDKFDLREIDKPEPVSDDEMRKAARVEEQKLILENVLYTENADKESEILNDRQKEAEKARSVADGAKEYIPDFSVNDIGSRKVTVSLIKRNMSLYVDDVLVDSSIELGGGIEKGYIELGAQRSRNNLRDDVYDAVFNDLVIENIGREQQVLYDNRLKGGDKVKSYVSEKYNAVIDWFVENF